MAHWQITSDAGMDLGTYEADTAEDAIRAMNADAGLSGDDLDRDDGLTVEEVL